MEEQTLEGTKFDDNKLRVSEFLKDFLIPIIEVTKVWQYGAEVHGVGNWKEVKNGYKRFSNALNRHLLKSEFEYCDDETGIMHEAHIAWNALTMIYFKIKESKERYAYNIKANMQYPVAVSKANLDINPPLNKSTCDREPEKCNSLTYNMDYMFKHFSHEDLCKRAEIDHNFAIQLIHYKDKEKKKLNE